MAIIQYTGIVNQIRGKLNGSVFNRSRTAFTLQRKQQAPRANAGFQPEIRQIFSAAQRSWKTVSSVNKGLWQTAAENNPARDRFGNLVALSGYNQYIKAFVLDQYGEHAGIGTPDPNPAPAAGLDVLTIGVLEYSVGPGGFPQVHIEATLTLDDLVPDIALIIDVSLPIGPGVTAYYGRYSNVYGVAISSTVNVDQTVSLGPKYPLPVAGQRIQVRTRLVYYANGAVVNTYINTVIPTIV